jgi:dephospho-CoA kinase
MTTAIVLYGPKAVGKSWVAEVLRTHLGVAHVDADELVLGLLAAGARVLRVWASAPKQVAMGRLAGRTRRRWWRGFAP